MIKRTLFLVNRTRSARYDEDLQIIPALNVAMDSIVNDRYDDLKRTNRQYSFETFERIKAELRTIVVRRMEIVPTQNKIINLPSDFRYEAGLRAVINDKEVPCTSLTFNQESPTLDNSFDRPSALFPAHLQWGDFIEIRHGGGTNVLNKVYLDYIKYHTEVSLGPEQTDNLVAGTEYYVSSDCTYNGIDYAENEFIKAVSGANTLTSGSVRSMVNCVLPRTLHEEVCKLAATQLSLHAGDITKAKNSLEMSEKS